MDLRDFFEQDIIIFLDRKLTYPEENKPEEMVPYIIRDYEEELLAALKEDNIFKAKKVIHDLKEEYDSYPLDAPERKQLRILLYSLYDKFKAYMEDRMSFQKLESEIKTIESKKFSKGYSEKDMVKDYSEISTIQKEIKENSGPEDHTGKITAGKMTENSEEEDSTLVSEFLQILRDLDYAIAKEDIEEAKRRYKIAKNLFQKLPLNHKSKHKERMISKYKQISSLIDKGGHDKPSEIRKASEYQENKSREKSNKNTNRLSELLEAIDDDLAIKNISNAKKHYSEAKIIYGLLSETEKKYYYPLIKKHYQKILDTITTQNHETKHDTNNDIKRLPVHKNTGTLSALKEKIVKSINNNEIKEAKINYDLLRDEVLRMDANSRKEWLILLREYYDRINSISTRSLHKISEPNAVDRNKEKFGLNSQSVTAAGSPLLEKHEKLLTPEKP